MCKFVSSCEAQIQQEVLHTLEQCRKGRAVSLQFEHVLDKRGVADGVPDLLVQSQFTF